MIFFYLITYNDKHELATNADKAVQSFPIFIIATLSTLYDYLIGLVWLSSS